MIYLKYFYYISVLIGKNKIMNVLEEIRKNIVVSSLKSEALFRRINHQTKIVEENIENEDFYLCQLNTEKLECLVKEFKKISITLRDSVAQLDVNDTHLWN